MAADHQVRDPNRVVTWPEPPPQLARQRADLVIHNDLVTVEGQKPLGRPALL